MLFLKRSSYLAMALVASRVRVAGTHTEVLDVGCGTGILGEHLLKTVLSRIKKERRDHHVRPNLLHHRSTPTTVTDAHDEKIVPLRQ